MTHLLLDSLFSPPTGEITILIMSAANKACVLKCTLFKMVLTAEHKIYIIMNYI